MPNMMNADDMETTLGEQLRALRIRQSIDQRQLAERAGVALNAVKGLEGGKGATVSSLVKVLRTLGRSDWLNTLAPAVSVDPLQMLKSPEPRKRAARKMNGKVKDV